MKNTISVVCFIFCFVIVGCSTPVSSTRVYFATVDRVEMPEGVYFTTQEGSAPMTYLYFRLHETEKSVRPRILEVQVLDKYDPTKYGAPDDVVSFRCATLKFDTVAVAFESLADFRVITKTNKQKQ